MKRGKATPIGGFYKVENPIRNAMQGMSSAANTYGRMQAGHKTVYEGPGKSAGGAIMGGRGVRLRAR